MFTSEHHATHAATSEQLHRVVTRNRLRRTLQLDATVFTKKRQVLVGRGCLRLLAPAAVDALDHYEHRPRRYSRILCRFRKIVRLSRDFNEENRFTTLNLIAVIQKSILHTETVEKSAVRRSQIAQV